MATLPLAHEPFDPEEDLACLQEMLARGDVASARRFLEQLERRWPDLAWVRYYVQVLAPPRVISRRARVTSAHDQEYDWLAEHAAAYPGCWIAVLGDRLLVADPSLCVVEDAVRQAEGGENALLHFQPGEAV